jgi:hypothetical protein
MSATGEAKARRARRRASPHLADTPIHALRSLHKEAMG